MGISPPLALAIGVPELGGIIIAVSIRPELPWYKSLDKPKWAPPGPLIGATWAVLYACMGYASYLVWQSSADPGMALSIYALQLALNLAWPFIFFKQKQLRAASIFNLGTLAGAIATTVSFWGINQSAGKLMLPYLCWLAYANTLNLSVDKKNVEASASMGSNSSWHSPRRTQGRMQRHCPSMGRRPLTVLAARPARSRGAQSQAPQLQQLQRLRLIAAAAAPHRVISAGHALAVRLA